MNHRYARKLLSGCLLAACLSPLGLTTPAQAGYANPDPSAACHFLDDRGMATRGYKDLGLGYVCSSPYRDLEPDSLVANNLAYYGEGEVGKVTRLKLVLNVNVPTNAEPAKAELAASAEALVKKALKAPLPPKAKAAILSGRSGSWKVGPASLVVEREDWPTDKGYTIKFCVE